jgi:SAM-dependent methyltransferase
MTLTPDQLPEGWTDGAADYEAWFSPLTRRFCVNAVELLQLHSGEHLLDVAAGTGAMTFAALGEGAHVTAVDFAPGMIDRIRVCAATEGHEVTLGVMDGQCLEFPDETFDVAVSMFGLIFFPDLDAGARELVRVARPDGRILVGAWDAARFPLPMAVGRAIGLSLPGFTRPLEVPAPFRVGNAPALGALLARAGCQDVSVLEVTHDWVMEDPVAIFRSLPSWAAPLKGIFELLGPDKLIEASNHFADVVEEMSRPTGGLSFTSLFAYGRRPQ